MTISSAIGKALPAAEAARKWRPAMGHIYQPPTGQPAAKSRGQESKGGTPAPVAENSTKQPAPVPTPGTQKVEEQSLERSAEEAFLIHMKHGGEYLDENPITGRPGEFHLSSTGRKPVLPPQDKAPPGIGTMNGPNPINTKVDEKKDSRTDKATRSATMPKPKRKKSKLGGGGTRTPTSA